MSFRVFTRGGAISFAMHQQASAEQIDEAIVIASSSLQMPLPEDGVFETEVTFDEPGTYVLRCLASDGALGVDSDVTVTVTE